MAPLGPPTGQRPPYRNLRIWIESFELALDIFQMAGALESPAARTLRRRLIDSSSRMPVAVARGQSSGSAREFVRCLHEGLADLSELETQILMCAELGHLSAEKLAFYEVRLAQIRRMTRALIRRLTAGTLPSQEPIVDAGQKEVIVSRVTREGRIIGAPLIEKGSALVAALLVAAALSILGLTFLQIADGESRIAARSRDRDQLLAIAETGARMVKTWFDAPVSGDPSDPGAVRHAFMGRRDLRDPRPFLRVRRLLDLDGDPLTPPVSADGSAGRELYRQGRELAAGVPHLDLFQKPFRGDTATAMLGTEEGPDIVLEDDPAAVDLLDDLNADLLGRQEVPARIERIEISGPPAARIGSASRRLGVALVKVTAALYRRLDRSGPVPVVPAGESPIARSIVRMGLAEIPTNTPRGPLEACGSITARGRLRAAWGRVIAVNNVTLADALDRLDATVASSFPYGSLGRHIAGSAPGQPLAAWLASADNSVEDPWLKVLAGGVLVGWESLGDQPFPFDPLRQIDLDHSNLFQRVPGLACPSFDYRLWKQIATASMPADRYVHYFTYDAATGLFREAGGGPPRSVRDWTNGQQGIFFFDTADGNPPGPGNLTPPVVISGGDWSTAGLIYLNARSFQAGSVKGTDRVLLPPGEPFDDADQDLAYDPGETFVNLRYATSWSAGASSDDMLKEALAAQSARATSPDGETYALSTTTARDARGTPLLAQVNLFGVLFNAGDIVAEGDAVHYGSLVAGRNVVQTTANADTPAIYFDARLNTGEWPPAEIAMPRTYVTFWQTSHP
jgi:four helix bundle protein